MKNARSTDRAYSVAAGSLDTKFRLTQFSRSVDGEVSRKGRMRAGLTQNLTRPPATLFQRFQGRGTRPYSMTNLKSTAFANVHPGFFTGAPP